MAAPRSRRRSRPLREVPLRGTGGHPSVVDDLPEARDGEGQLSKDALRTPAPRLIEHGYLAPRLGCQLAANIPLHATAEAGFRGRRYRVYLESASDSVALEHLRGACGRVR